MDVRLHYNSDAVNPEPELEFEIVSEKKTITPELAFGMAMETPPHSHRITNLPKKTLRICTLGCHGDKHGKVKEVIALLNDMIEKNPELKPDVILITGDNYYPD